MLTSRKSLVNIVSQFPNLSLTYALLTVGTQYWTSNLLVSCAQRSHNTHLQSHISEPGFFRFRASQLPQMQEYQYSPLASGDIRIFILFPGEFDDPLQGQIVHEKVTFEDEHEAYEALSYVWGSQDDPETLTVLAHTIWGLLDDEELYEIGSLRIGQNLASALRHLRYKTDFRALWCDAVCINQNDLDERAAQVLRMGYIYKYAARVVVWLGAGGEDTSGAISTLNTIGSPWSWSNEDMQLYLGDDRDKDTYLRKAEDGSHMLSPAYQETILQTDWQCLLNFLRLPWFSRLWVRQEIGLANDSAIVVLGNQEARWSTLGDAICFITNFMPHTPLSLEQFTRRELQQRAAKAAGIVVSSCLPNPRSLPFLLLNTSYCECLDQRDRIYGILGFHPLFNIQPDYTKSVKQVYTDAFRSLAGIGTGDLLSFCDMADGPSWVPNFTRSIPTSAGCVVEKVSGASKAVFTFLPGSLARTLGVLCGTVASCLPPIPDVADEGLLKTVVHSWIHRVFSRDVNEFIPYVADDLVSTVTLGKVNEYLENAILTLRRAQNVLLRDVRGYNLDKSVFKEGDDLLIKGLFELGLLGSALHKTQESFFALGNAAARPGDRIFVILGCQHPIILRPLDQERWRVVGSCFMHSRARMEAVLGDLPVGWQMKYTTQGTNYFFGPDGMSTHEDPRLEPLPTGWIHYFDDTISRHVWVNPEGEKEFFDPRLSAERLRARGVKLEELTLV